MAEMPGQKKGKQMTKTVLVVLSFITAYVAISLMPAPVAGALGFAAIIGLLVFIVRLLIAIGKVSR
jgi:hypothetical protein